MTYAENNDFNSGLCADIHNEVCAQTLVQTCLQSELWTHADSAVTAGTDSSPAQLLSVAQIDYDISSSLISLLIHSVSALPFKLFLQSQENLNEP